MDKKKEVKFKEIQVLFTNKPEFAKVMAKPITQTGYYETEKIIKFLTNKMSKCV